MSNVIKMVRREAIWEQRYGNMQMINLLEEMVKYQEEKQAAGENRMPEFIPRGIVLFNYIATRCETPELRNLATTYVRHLEHERLALRTIERK